MSCLFRSLSILLRYKIGPIDVQKFRNFICDKLHEHFEHNIGDEKLKVWLEYCNLDENKEKEHNYNNYRIITRIRHKKLKVQYTTQNASFLQRI